MDRCLLCGLKMQRLMTTYVIFCVVVLLHSHVTQGDPSLPDLPQQFQTVIEATIVDRNLTMTGREYYDGPGNKGMVQMSGSKLLAQAATSMIFDYANDQIYLIQDRDCLVSDFEHGQTEMFFGGNQTVNGHPHVISTGSALRFAKKFGEQYKGQTTVRGILVDHWKSNQISWSFRSANFTLDYYFTATNWTDAIGYPQIPVRAIVKGVEINDSGVIRNFTHYYEYVDFKPMITDTSVFETPSGTVCIGRKKSKPIPKLPSAYHYRQEIIYGRYSSDKTSPVIEIADVWYDQIYRLIRLDYHYPKPAPPAYTTNPVTEIHDFNDGLRYVIDQTTGQCLVKALANSSFGVAEPLAARRTHNGSRTLHMKDPMQLFFMDNNYTYTGMRTVRGVPCKVFTELRFDYPTPGITNPQAILEYYFIDDGYIVVPDDDISTPKDVPIRLIVSIPDADVKVTYNFMDFSTDHPDMSVFVSILPCYSEALKLQFTVRFAGQYKNKNSALLKLEAHRKLVAAMGVSWLRVQALRLHYDNSFIYISAILLDRSFAQAQFTLRSSTTIEHLDDLAYPFRLVGNVADCADACVNMKRFTCNSFEFCKGDESGSCRFSKAYIGDGVSKVINSTCDHYSRTITGPVKQKLQNNEAYNNLVTSVYAGNLTLSGFTDSAQQKVNYTAVDVSVTFGWISPRGVPALSSQFSLHLEDTIPTKRLVYNVHMWYDFLYKLVKYEFEDIHTHQSISRIHDYNTGLAYAINTVTKQCQVSAIANYSDDAISPSASPGVVNTTGFVLRMKNPLEIFDLTNKYKYAGQKTVRGILCDVYENTGMFDFGFGVRVPSIFQMHFMTKGWSELSANSGIPVATQPIRLIMTAVKGQLTEYYDFYDFNEQQPDLANFNIAPCFVGNQHHFLVKFNQTYHPTLDRNLAKFMKNMQMILAMTMNVTPLRIQNPEVTYQGPWTYYIATMVEQAPTILDFTKTSNKSAMYSSDGTFVDIQSDQDCAAICRSTSAFRCKSFDYCPRQKYCQLSSRHVSDGPLVQANTRCDHYSKTVDAPGRIEPTVKQSLSVLAGRIKDGSVTLPIKTHSSTSVTYKAVMLDTNIERHATTVNTVNRQTLKHFDMMNHRKLSVVPNDQVRGLSVVECAARCLRLTTFDCQSFDYCPDIGMCHMASVNPLYNASVVKPAHMCDVYRRRYTDIYTAYPATFTKPVSVNAVSNSSDANMCARLCTGSSSVQCRSFDYCTTNQLSMCYLNTKHVVDTAPAAVTPGLACTHYSKKYIVDFSMTPKRSFSSGNWLTVMNVSAEGCAQLCVGQSNLACTAFTFCGNQSKCTMVSVTVVPSLVQNTSMCDLYTRKYFPTSNVQPPPKPSAQKTSGYGSGAMAGVGVGLLIIGILFGALVLHCRSVAIKPKANSGDDGRSGTPMDRLSGIDNPVHKFVDDKLYEEAS